MALLLGKFKSKMLAGGGEGKSCGQARATPSEIEAWAGGRELFLEVEGLFEKPTAAKGAASSGAKYGAKRSTLILIGSA